MKHTVVATQKIQKKHQIPVDSGAELAWAVIYEHMRMSFDKSTQEFVTPEFKDIVVDMRGVQPARMIASMFNSFWQTIYERNPDWLEPARKGITWLTDHVFQLELIQDWTNWFEPREDDSCQHESVMPEFDPEDAENLSYEEVLKKYPRFHGVCPDCNQQVILYASAAHFAAVLD